jgi:hypothetical protein
MKRSMLQAALFALFLLAGHSMVRADPPPEVEWKWVETKFEKTGKQIGGKDTYKLIASGDLIFEGKLNSVSKEDSRFYVYLAPPETPNIFPAEPNEKFKVTVSEQKKRPPTETHYFYTISAIATINQMPDGEPYPFFAGYTVKILPVIKYTKDGVTKTSQFEPPAYPVVK